MINLITEGLLDTIVVNKRPYFINTNFRTWIKVSQLFQNRELNNEEKVVAFFKLTVKGDIISEDAEDLANGLIEFYVARERSTKVSVGHNVKGEIRGFDYDFDSDYIYAAFYEQYKIDLCFVDLHWWQFRALFNALNENTELVKIMSYRAINLAEIKDKDRRKHYKKMKDIHSLPRIQKNVSVENEFVDMIDKMF